MLIHYVLVLRYLRFSSIAARTVRRALKSDVKSDPLKELSTIKKVEVKAK